MYGLIIDQHDDQLPFGLIAQLVEHCTGIAEVRIRVTFRPEFFRPFFCYSSSTAKLWRSLEFVSIRSSNEVSLICIGNHMISSAIWNKLARVNFSKTNKIALTRRAHAI